MYWATMGVLYLLVLTYQDIFKKRLVDDRYNYLMIGATIPLIINSNLGLWVIAIGISLSIGLTYMFGKMNVFGQGDLKAILWSFLGFFSFGYVYVIHYIVAFVFCYFLFVGYYKILEKVKKIKYTLKLPGFPILLLSYITVVFTNFNIFFLS
jgi:hypothetical protein